MAGKGTSLIDRLAQNRAMRQWARAARHAGQAHVSDLRAMRNEARQLRTYLDSVIHKADERLALPRTGATGMPLPHNVDWSWRPELWAGPLPKPGMASAASKSMLGSEVTLFHDCKHSELSLRQVRNRREEDLAPYGLCMDVFRFDGSFLSLVVDLPGAAIDGLQKSHLIAMHIRLEVERHLPIFARLNIRHGPNTDQLVRALPMDDIAMTVEFDLAYSKINDKRVEHAWIDLIFDGPEMNQIMVRDLVFSRRPRAAL